MWNFLKEILLFRWVSGLFKRKTTVHNPLQEHYLLYDDGESPHISNHYYESYDYDAEEEGYEEDEEDWDEDEDLDDEDDWDDEDDRDDYSFDDFRDHFYDYDIFNDD